MINTLQVKVQLYACAIETDLGYRPAVSDFQSSTWTEMPQRGVMLLDHSLCESWMEAQDVASRWISEVNAAAQRFVETHRRAP
jgi:hypothetical protein